MPAMHRLLAGLCLTAITLTAAVPAMAQQGPSGVATDFVERRVVSETIPIFGQVVGSSDSDVAARVAGVVQSVAVRVGDRVSAGDVLADLDRELLDIEHKRAEAAVIEARAGIEVAEAGLLLAEQALARAAGLQNTTAFSQRAFEDGQGSLARSRGELAQAQARLLNAEAALARADYDLDRATVRAPFDAVVLEVFIDPGEFIPTGAQVVRLVDVGDLEVEANVPGQYIVNLSEEQLLEGALQDGTALEMTVRAILPTEATATRTRPVRFTGALNASASPVALGQSLTVFVPITTAREALLVPKDAVAQSRGTWQVFVHRDGKAVPQAVEIGTSFGATFEVLSGLAPGDEVVVRGNERLRPMQDIAPQPVRERPGQAAAAPEDESRNADGAQTRQAAAVQN
ncbi:MAG: efflux RND transporter periplasmic adaptor subunit [Pseudomonadota bacterium]